MVSAVQVKNAQCVIAARSRVGAVVAASLDVVRINRKISGSPGLSGGTFLSSFL